MVACPTLDDVDQGSNTSEQATNNKSDGLLAKTYSRILIVEDDPDLQWQLARILTIQGNRVVGTSSGDGALALIEQWLVDLVFIDDDLPGMSGLELARAIHRSHPSIALVLMLSQEGQDLHEQAAEAGVLTCLYKPLNATTIADIVSQFRKRRLTTLPPPPIT